MPHIRIFSVVVVCLLCTFCVGCMQDNYELNTNPIYFKSGDTICKYENDKIALFVEDDVSNNFKFDGHTLCWANNFEENLSYINLFDINTGENIQLQTNFEIYDLACVSNYIVFSGISSVDFSYNIIAKNIDTSEELCISNTQNNQVEFSYYKNEIYFLEPNDSNHLYKYNLSSKTKSKVSDLVENKSSVKVNLFVDENGVYFTKCTFNKDNEESNLYRLDFNNNEVILVAQNIDNIIGTRNRIIYGIFNDKENEIIYEINPYNYERKKLFKSNEFIESANIQDEYLICNVKNLFNEEDEKIYIIKLSNGEIIKTIT